MAHGFLTPESVSGDNFWKNAKDLWSLLQRLKKRKAPPEEVVPAVVSELQKALPPGKQKLLSPGAQKLLSGSNQKALPGSKPANMFQGAPVAKMLGAGKSEITIKQQLALPPGGPKLPPGASSSGKGGTFTNLPGISAAPKKLDSEAFFKAAQTGVDPQTGRYLSSEERKDFLKKSKAQMDAPASVASAGIASASTSITKGDEEIVSSVENLTKVVTSLVDAVKAQTSAQLKAANAQKASTERTANRALAAAEESSLEQSADLSGTITPTGGIGSMAPGSGSGGGGGLLGAAGSMVAGKVAGKTAQAVTKRGLSRALPRIGASVAGKAGARAGAQTTAKIGTNVAAKTGGKALARMIPGVQTALGVGFAMDSFSKGDVLGGLLNLGSAIPGPLGWAFLGGSVANDLAKGGAAEAAPFAEGGIITQPTLSIMGEGKKKEGVFPLEGKEGDKVFMKFGEGLIDAQMKNKREYAQLASAGMKQYYENEDGNDKLAKSLSDVFKGLKDFFNFGGGDDDNGGGGGGGGGGGDFSGSSGQDQAMNYFMSQGLTKDQSAGIVGNLMQESGAGIDPNAKNKTGHRGIAQWDKNRWGNFEKWAKKKGLDVNTREAQLQWIMEEMRTGDGGLSLKTLKGAKTSRQSAELFLKQYERSGEEAGSAGFENRMKNAAALSKREISGGGGQVLSTGRLPALPDTGTAHGQNYGAGRKGGRKHAGVDFDIRGNDKFFSRIGGTVTRVGYDPSGYGNYVDIYNEQLKVTERIAEGKTVLVKQGQKVSPGTAIVQGETNTGVIHYEIRKDNGGFGFAGSVNPLNFLASATKQTGDVAAKPGARPTTASRGAARTKSDLIGSAAPANQPSGVQLAQASTADAVSQRRNTRGGGTTIINNNNTQSGSGAQVASAAPAGGSSSMGLGALAIRLAS